jgi:hypothetical protein
MDEIIYDMDEANSDNLGNEKISGGLDYNQSNLMKKKLNIV